MAEVIIPQPSVFLRNHATLIVFGAYRLLGAAEIPYAAQRQLMETVRTARNYSIGCAFCRQTPENAYSHDGTWLPGCRPRTIDMMFDYTPPSCVSHPEFKEALLRRGSEHLIFTGFDTDSDLTNSFEQFTNKLADHDALGSDLLMQKCSAELIAIPSELHRNAPHTAQSATTHERFRRRLRRVQSIG